MIATGGDTHLGGDDIDNLLIAIALDDIAGDLGENVRSNGETVQAIRKAVIEAKIWLSLDDVARLDVTLPSGKRYSREITREQFEEIDRAGDRANGWPLQAGAERRRNRPLGHRRGRAGRRID